MTATQSAGESRVTAEGSNGRSRQEHEISDPDQQRSARSGTVDSSEEYRIRVEPDEDGVFIVSCPDIEGCYSYGQTLDEAFKNIADAIQISNESSETLRSEGTLTSRLINLDASVRIAVE